MSSRSVITFTEFKNSSVACIHGECIVRLKNGKMKQIQQLLKGDLVQCGTREFGRVLCLVEIYCDSKCPSDIVEFDTGLKITPWHPISGVRSKWEFPCKMHDGKLLKLNCSSLFNLLIERMDELDPKVFMNPDDASFRQSLPVGVSVKDLHRNTLVRKYSCFTDAPLNLGVGSEDLVKDKDVGVTTDLVYYDPVVCSTYHDTIVVNDIPCITLGNGIVQDEVAHHPYFSSDEVIYDLSQCRGWATGHVIFDIGGVMRNKDTGLAKGFDLSKEVLLNNFVDNTENY